MLAPCVQVWVTGSNSDVIFVPSWGAPATPPTTITRPSASVDWPAQWRSPNVAGASVNVPVAGSQTRALLPVDQTSTLFVERVTMCLAWMPQSSNGPHSPVSMGAATSSMEAISGPTGAASGTGLARSVASTDAALLALTVDAGAQTMP